MAVASLFRNIPFFASVLDAIPCGIMICDPVRDVHYFNRQLADCLQISSTETLGLSNGELLGCSNLTVDKGVSCGRTKRCSQCIINEAVTETLNRGAPYRAAGPFHCIINGRNHTLKIEVSTAPLHLEQREYVLITIENLDQIAPMNTIFKPSGMFKQIIGGHPAVCELRNLLLEASQVDLPVLLLGESGTGKELAANAIHQESNRREQPFITINCSAIPENLLESELFGHVKGAFTGAVTDKKGRFELADGGTLFLDEIGELTPPMQAKLLRFLQESSFERVGGTNTIHVDVRFISATNRDLEREVEAGNFRLDLFYRLCVVPIRLPPLRERRSDIHLLAEHFLYLYDRYPTVQKRSFAAPTMDLMENYHWPGNIRELQNVIKYLLMKCKGTKISPQLLPTSITSLRWKTSPPLIRDRPTLQMASVTAALARNDGNKSRAARELGVSRATLYRFIHREMGKCQAGSLTFRPN